MVEENGWNAYGIQKNKGVPYREAISIFLMGVSFPTFDIGLYMNELLQNLLNEPEKKKSPSIRQRNENSTPSAWQARRNDTFLTLS
ncbi:MAG: hypothetical protein ACYC9S_13705 [Leptospirales bacterium]